MKSQEENHAVLLRQQKEVVPSCDIFVILTIHQALLAGEKIKRDKWMEAQTQAIKESTIKGLEPEIQRLISSHKNTVQRLNDEHVFI
jgi:5-azacytidine-induced protein 1